MSDMQEAAGGKWGPAIVGGIIGALLTGAIGLAIVPRMVGPEAVRRAIIADPSMLVDAGNALRDRQYAPVIAANRIAIETPYGSSWKGAATPDVTLVEYYDYACTYCRKSIPDIERLLAEDKGLRVVFRELPILGPNSLTAARVALAASKAGTPDYLRAQDIAMVSEAALKKDKNKKK